MLPGCHVADAPGARNAAAASGVTGSPLLTTAAAATVPAAAPNSRRAEANTAQPSGPVAESPPPPPSQANTLDPTASTEPAAARGADLNTGAVTAGASHSTDETGDGVNDEGISDAATGFRSRAAGNIRR